ncbi:MAG: protein translocase subunit SecD [Actinobacteria bacterium]|nr:protein translocase subunit SecD [Actinomycetota bacterium]
MGKRGLVTAFVAFVVVVAAMWATIIALGWQPQLGLDLRGGVTITLIPAPNQGEVDQEKLDQTVSVIRQRVDALGVAEPDIARQGQNIQVQLPGVADQQRAEEVIGRTAVLQFRRVLGIVPPGSPQYDEVGGDCDDILDGPPPADEEVVLCGQEPDVGGETEDTADIPLTKYELGPVEVAGDDVEDATAEIEQTGLNWFVSLDFSRSGDQAFQQLTGELACEPVGAPTRQLAIVLDGRVESAPEVNADVGCNQGISGGGIITVGGEEEARDLAVVLRTGALPLQLEFAQSQSVSPTLGRDSLIAGLQAGIVGLLLVALYLIVLYRGLGALAVLELAMFGVVVYGLIIVLGNTVRFSLTLAGIAGIIVSIGIAADSSIIYRERYRDERRAGRTVRSAAEHAFRKAFRTNLTGNTVSFMAAVVLWLLAVGPVRGFAFTLGLSTLIDTILFAAFTRSTFGLVARSPRLANASWMGLRTASATSDEPEARPRQKVKSR